MMTSSMTVSVTMMFVMSFSVSVMPFYIDWSGMNNNRSEVDTHFSAHTWFGWARRRWCNYTNFLDKQRFSIFYTVFHIIIIWIIGCNE
jgi:hypothetical protein